jgi:CO/xanthine dehydrogenase FAD-binding subunit
VADRAYLADVSAAVNTRGEPDELERAVADVTRGVTVNDDIHASAAYRTQLARTAAKRALATAYDRAG